MSSPEGPAKRAKTVLAATSVSPLQCPPTTLAMPVVTTASLVSLPARHTSIPSFNPPIKRPAGSNSNETDTSGDIHQLESDESSSSHSTENGSNSSDSHRSNRPVVSRGTQTDLVFEPSLFNAQPDSSISSQSAKDDSANTFPSGSGTNFGSGSGSGSGTGTVTNFGSGSGSGVGSGSGSGSGSDRPRVGKTRPGAAPSGTNSSSLRGSNQDSSSLHSGSSVTDRSGSHEDRSGSGNNSSDSGDALIRHHRATRSTSLEHNPHGTNGVHVRVTPENTSSNSSETGDQTKDSSSTSYQHSSTPPLDHAHASPQQARVSSKLPRPNNLPGIGDNTDTTKDDSSSGNDQTTSTNTSSQRVTSESGTGSGTGSSGDTRSHQHSNTSSSLPSGGQSLVQSTSQSGRGSEENSDQESSHSGSNGREEHGDGTSSHNSSDIQDSGSQAPGTNASQSVVDDTGRYVCPVCSRSYQRKSHLNRHLKSHAEKYDFRCGICGRDFYRKDQLSLHLRTHVEEGSFVCPVATCSKTFRKQRSLEQHLIMHKLSKQNDGGNHVRNNSHGLGSHACRLCGQRFPTFVAVVQHENQHIMGSVEPAGGSPRNHNMPTNATFLQQMPTMPAMYHLHGQQNHGAPMPLGHASLQGIPPAFQPGYGYPHLAPQMSGAGPTPVGQPKFVQAAPPFWPSMLAVSGTQANMDPYSAGPAFTHAPSDNAIDQVKKAHPNYPNGSAD
ncbi:uncharacterized protein MONBRDRAFT_30763 [Monosiga brevicollis MX1]|uniref:C2H2-type domain-containing protein n=1 Tax=Monosiga brevicollis TaxID=81824 RepID=A9UP21_MONBE|nr:uncharacterized protein MONBRDRAFT_30763 [Monosiga brevicollis MX1]EDQ92798.1 predicted protein [Monosiga brevicollis MX1]|eukprot:XP_001742560.1 hypothetical protein [Monosiga brevicollis MX1]